MYYLGVDVGGTNIAVGIVDENNAIIAKASHPTPATMYRGSASAARAPLTVLPASLNLLTTSISRTSSSAT